MKIRFVASFAPIVRDVAATHALYRDAVGIAFEGVAGDYLFTEKLEGVKHFGLWPLEEAAQACFGTAEWPAGILTPQASYTSTAPRPAPDATSSSCIPRRPCATCWLEQTAIFISTSSKWRVRTSRGPHWSRPVDGVPSMRWQDQLQEGDQKCRSDQEPSLTIRSVVGSQPVTNG